MITVKGNSSQGLWGATLGFFIGLAAVSLFGPTASKFKDIMNLTPVMVGFLVAMPSLSGSLLRIPFSAWVDTTGGRKPFLILLFLSIVGMLSLTVVVGALYPDKLNISHYPLLLFLGLLSGCGIATFSVGISQVSYWFPQKKQGRALGIYAGVGNVSPGLFSFLLPVALKEFGLQGSYVAWVIFLCVGTIIYFFIGRNAWYFQLLEKGLSKDQARKEAAVVGEEIFPAGTFMDSLSISARISKTWLLVIMYFSSFGGFIALTAWLPTYWKSLFGVTIISAGLLTALYSISTSVIRIAGGYISDKFGGEKTTVIAFSLMLFGAILMTMSGSFYFSIFAEIVLASGMGIANAAIFKIVPQAVPKAVGGAAGWIGGLGALGGFVIPPLMGLFVKSYDMAGYSKGFVVYVALAVVSLILVGVLHKLKIEPK